MISPPIRKKKKSQQTKTGGRGKKGGGFATVSSAYRVKPLSISCLMIFPFPACNPHVDRQKSYKTTSTVLQAFPPKSLNTRLTLISRNIIIMIKMVIFRVILLTFKLLLLTGVLLGPEYSVDCPTFYPPSAA